LQKDSKKKKRKKFFKRGPIQAAHRQKKPDVGREERKQNQ
jgi:hypothetical protein